MADYELSAQLNDDQVLAALKRIDANVEKLAKNGEEAFKRMEAGGTKSAKSLGVLTGASTAVTQKIIEMGSAAARTFGEIVKGAVDSAKALEVTEQSLIGIFQGNEKAALGALKRIREESIRLGVDLTELAPAFLPKVEDLDQFAKIGELVAGLANLDPAQGAAGARLALSEALSGDVTSLRRRFEIDTDPIKQAQAELGELDGLLVGLEEVLRSRGQDFETLGNTAAVTFGQTQAIAEDVQKTLGEPILDALKEDLRELNQFFIENKDSIDIIAGSLGDLLADIADFGGDQLLNFTEGLDLEAIQNLVLDLQNLLAIIEAYAEFREQRPLAGAFDGVRERIPDFIDMKTAVTALIQVIALLDAAVVGSIEGLKGYADIAGRLLSGDLSFSDLNDELLSLGRNVEGAMAESLRGATDTLDGMNQAMAENEQRLADRTAAVKEDTSAGEALADSLLGEKQAAEDAAAAADEYTEAQDKLNAARAEFDTEKERAGADLALKQQRELLDAEIGFAQKREDNARKNAQAIQDIYRKNQQQISNAARDLSRNEEDIARNGARSQIEIEQEAASRRVGIETDFRRELQRIRDRFDFDAQEAIRQNDAIAFLRIQRQKDFELQAASEQREEDIQDAEQQAVDQRQALQQQLQYQIEDARIANQRKLEDLRLSLEAELQEQRIRYGREVQEAQIAEQRKREELRKTFQQQQQDFDTYWNRRLQDLQQKYQREIEITQRYEAQLAKIRSQARANARRAADEETTQRMIENNDERGDRGSRSGRSSSLGNQTPSSGYTPNPTGSPAAALTGAGRRFGDYTPGGIDFLVGEAGPEIVRLPVSGNIIPNHRLKFNPATASQVTNINTRSTNLNLEAMMNLLSPQQLAIVQQLVTQLQMSLYQ